MIGQIQTVGNFCVHLVDFHRPVPNGIVVRLICCHQVTSVCVRVCTCVCACVCVRACVRVCMCVSSPCRY